MADTQIDEGDQKLDREQTLRLLREVVRVAPCIAVPKYWSILSWGVLLWIPDCFHRWAIDCRITREVASCNFFRHGVLCEDG